MVFRFAFDEANRGVLPTPEGDYLSFVVFDLNGDGFDDIIADEGSFPGFPGPRGAFPVRILLNDGENGFDEVPIEGGSPLTTFTGLRQTFFEDFNGDGLKDLLLVDFGFDQTPLEGAVNRLLLGDGAGGFRNASNLMPDTLTASFGATVGDIDGDGDLDFFDNSLNVDATPRDETPTIFLNDGTGRFSEAPELAPDVVTVTDAGGAPLDVLYDSLLFDIDLDGAEDLIVGPENTGFNNRIRTTAVFLNDGSGDFSAVEPILTPEGVFGPGGQVEDLHAIDLDGDIFDDLLVVVASASAAVGGTPEYELILLRSNGDGTFENQTAQRMPAFASGQGATVGFVELVDFEFDGDIDIVGYNFAGGSDPNARPFVWLNDGTGVFDRVLFLNDVVDSPGGVSALLNTRDEEGVSLIYINEDPDTGTTTYQIASPMHELDRTKVLTPPAPVIGEGADVIRGDAADEVMLLLGGDDQASGAGGDDVIDGGEGADLALGGAGADTLLGQAGNDTLRGGLDRDRLEGGGGKDELSGGRDKDRLFGGGAKDLLMGGDGNDKMEGGGGRDVLLGGEGKDKLKGDGGADRLDGGAGNDKLTGGGGRDRFIFTEAGRDKVLDFQDRKDKIQIEGAERFADLTIIDRGASALVRFDDIDVLLRRTDVEDLSAADFLF